MRLIAVIVAVRLFSLWLMSTADAGQVCDQTTYDQIYKELIQQVLNHPLTQESIETKNNSIEILRKLCHNQLSSLETGRK